MNAIQRTTLVVLVLCAISSCSSVEPGDLTGTWVMTDASRRRLPAAAQQGRTRIVFEANGTFTATDLPGFFSSDARDAGRLEHGTGAWKVERFDDEQQVLLQFRTRTRSADPVPFGGQLHIGRHDLFYFVGDPDDGLRVSFEKVTR